MAATLRLELLGGFRVAVGEYVVPDDAWRRRKAAGLVKLLALAPGHKLHREQIMDALWPELAPNAAAANLRKAIHYARRALDVDGDHLIASAGELLCLPADGVWMDVEALRTAAAQARRTADPALYAEAVELYRDEQLPEDRYEEWTFALRDELQSEYVALLEELAALLESRGELEGAGRAANRLVATEPLRESGHLLLIRLHALAGRRAEAMRRYEQLRDTLAAELGTEPSPQAQ